MNGHDIRGSTGRSNSLWRCSSTKEREVLLRAPYTRFALAASILGSARIFVWANAFCLLSAILNAFGLVNAHPFLAAFITFNAASLLLWVLLAPRKGRARESCNIIFLRGFQQAARADVANRVVPSIGCYGRVIWPVNIIKRETQDYTGEMLSDARGQPKLSRSDAWKPEVEKLMNESDLAVIDFTYPRESLKWEIGRCLERFTAKRIILIAELSPHVRDDYLEICRTFPEILEVSSKIPLYPSRYYIPRNPLKWWVFRFERLLNARMQEVAEQTVGENAGLLAARV